MGNEPFCRRATPLPPEVLPLIQPSKAPASKPASDYQMAAEPKVCRTRPPAQTPTPEQRDGFLEQVGSLEPAKVLDKVVAWRDDPAVLRGVITGQPAMVPQLLQQAMEAGDFDSAKWIAKEIESRFLATLGAGSEAELMFRGALRLDGTGSDEVRGVMRAMVHKRNVMFRQIVDNGLYNGIPADGANATHADDKGFILDQAAKDPAGGRLYARYHDDPAAAATQLHQEALSDPNMFKRHAGSLSNLINRAPASAAAITSEIVALKGEGATAVRLWLAAELHEAMVPAIRLINEYMSGSSEIGDPRARIATLAPLLAQVVADPEVVHEFHKQHEFRARLAPAHVPEMRHMLRDVLSPRHAGTVSTEVREALGRGGAALLRDSVTAAGPLMRKARADDGGKFLAELASAEADVKEMSFATALGEMLTTIGTYLPLPRVARSGAKIGGAILKDIGETESPRTWAAEEIERLMRHVYEEEHPPPEGFSDSEAVRRHDDDFVSWQMEARNAYTYQIVKELLNDRR